jgi:spermidine synthase
VCFQSQGARGAARSARGEGGRRTVPRAQPEGTGAGAAGAERVARLGAVSKTSNLEVLAYEETPLGMICLRRRELLSVPGTVVTEITLDHEMLMSSYITASERALSSLALERHEGHELSVLIGGLGLGYTAHEVLRSPSVVSVDVVEFLPQVVEWMRDGLVPLSDELNADERFHVVNGDVYAMLAAAPERHYDLILIDVDHSPDERLGSENEGFYGEAGVLAAKKHLAPGGLLGVWSYAESSPFAEAMRAAFARVDVEQVSFENTLIEETETNWLFLGRDA